MTKTPRKLPGQPTPPDKGPGSQRRLDRNLKDSGISFRETPVPDPPQPPAESPPESPEDASELDLSVGGDEDDKPYKIEWFDEDRPPAAGRFFAEAPPEPPRQALEIIREKPPRRPRALRTAPACAPKPKAKLKGAAGREMPPLHIRLFWGLMPLILLVGGYGAVVSTQGRVGYSWDEAFFYEPSVKAAEWLVEVLRGKAPFDRASIEFYWSGVNESQLTHPSMQKLLSGLALYIFPEPSRHLFAIRFPMAILFGLSLSLIYLLGRRAWGTMPGLVGALIYAVLPRAFGHAHFASLETPLIFFTLLVVFCFLRGLYSPVWALLTGLSFGLLLATKINAFFVPIPLILWAHLYARGRYVNNLFSMLILGPLVMIAAWPWLWPDPAPRILEYLLYHARHQQTALFFLGRRWGYGLENAPWFYPLVMTALTLPLTALIVIVLGLIRTLRGIHRRPYGALFLACAVVTFAVACAPSTPRYDGVRLFLSAFPFLALLGASGMAGLLSRFEHVAIGKSGIDDRRLRRLDRMVGIGVAIIVLFEGGLAIMRYHPYELSYFNPLVGGLSGAARRGFEVTYWGESLNSEVIERLNRLPDNPDGSAPSIGALALHELCLKHLQQWDLLRKDLRIGGPPPYDYHLLQMRRGFFNRPERALADSHRFPVVAMWEKTGVPILALYRTGAEFEYFWPTLRDDPRARLPRS